MRLRSSTAFFATSPARPDPEPTPRTERDLIGPTLHVISWLALAAIPLLYGGMVIFMLDRS